MIEVPGYEITETLYDGRVTAVYRARSADGEVVLKCLVAPYPTAQQIDAYRSEFAILSRIKSAGVLRARELREVGNGLVLVMESVALPTLRDAIKRGPMPVKKFLDFARQIVATVAEVHAAGITHKDINPDNILYDPNSGAVRLIDFDIATELPLEHVDLAEATQLEGSLPYLSPEQTGRVNRPLDSRTDLYSLGATFYEALTGKPPFESDHPMGILHGHIARSPRPLTELVPMPPVLSAIVLKLLAKDASERYQSCAGLLHDLGECDRQLRETYTVVDFPLARHDQSARFELPATLYGRDEELRLLLDGFERVCAGQTGVLVVEGYSGIGKSSLVNAVHRPLVRERGRFIEGKFDLYRRDKPLSAIVEAFRALVVQLLVEGDTDHWKREIELALGGNVGVIAQEIPEITHIVGKVAQPPDVGAMEARNRLQLAFQRLVSTIARRQSPLVIFIDDLQWADQASLQLMQAILTNPESGYLYFLGCYRGNEVGADHPLLSTLDSIGRVHPVQRISLPPLKREHLQALVSDAFGARKEEAAQLADVLLEKTAGNPFFVGEFLRALNRTKLFVHDPARGEWVWDAARIREQGPTENVSELMSARLGRLPAPTQEALAVAAGLGNQCEEATLAAVLGTDSREVQSRLAPAIEEGAIQRTSATAGRAPRYRFAHDRVQQAAYALIPEADRPKLHLKVGRLLLAQLEGEGRDARLFDIVDHLNAGRAELTTAADRTQLARLNLEAGQRAKASAAFGPALRYFATGIEALGSDHWNDEPDLTRALWLDRGESEFLNGNHEESARYLSEFVTRARSPVEAMQAYAIRIASHNARGQFVDAIGIGLEALGLLGIELPNDPGEIGRVTGAELGLVGERLANRSIESLIDLPPMTDPKLIEAIRILVYLTSTAYIGYPQIYPLIVAKQVNLSIEHGNAPQSAVSYSSYAVLNSPGGLGDLDTSYRFGELALAMLDREGKSDNVTNINFVFGTFVSHWRNHLSASIPYLDTACVASLEMGDFEYVKYSATFEAFYSVLMWHDLAAVREHCDRRRLMLQKVRMEGVSGAFMLARQMAFTISGVTDAERLSGADFDEDAAHAAWLQQNDFLSLSCLATSRLIVASLYRRPDAVALVDAAKPFLVANTGMFLLAEFHLAAALAFTDAARGATADVAIAHVARARESLALLEAWAEKSPVNFRHRVLLVRAEIAALGQDPMTPGVADVIRLYEEAAETARGSGFLLHEGIAYERAADFCEQVKLSRFSGTFLDDAIYAFERLGAQPKGDLLRRRRGEGVHEAHTERATRGQTVHKTTIRGFDSDSLLRAGHAISEAIRMDVLLAELMKILIETAGADRGALIRVTPGGLRVAATRDAETDEVQRSDIDLEAAAWVPASVVRYALRTMEPVVLRDARTEGPFQDDPAIRAGGARSVLCIPIVYRGKVESLLYLRNGLSSGVFTQDRIDGIKLLTGQIAVSLKNAELYEQLEERVKERTQQLEVRNRLIRQAFGRYLSDDVASTLLESPEGLTLGGERREVTILMADLRGFTPLTDRLPPESIVSIVNNFLGEMTDVIFRHQGTINEFIGDAILAIFGAPQRLSDHAERGVACAVEMQMAMDHVNARNRKLGLPAVEMGVSLHSGEVVVGNVGSEKRAKYGVVGRAVNVTARIESYSVGGQVLVSERTLSQVTSPVTTAREFEIHPKGVAKPLKVFEVTGIGGAHALAVPERAAVVAPLKAPLEIGVEVLQGKAAGQGFRPAQLTALSSSSASLSSAHALDVFDNLRVRLPAVGGDLTDVFAKVMSADRGGIFSVRFTSLPPEAQEWIDGILHSAAGSPVDSPRHPPTL
jgi:predicted ATPase/class 3 adenylate cyclase/tRNA A-37 threonylcarbamoyl transferase component Bud32